MKIVYNMFNLRSGGGESVGLNILNTLYHTETSHFIHIILSSTPNYKVFTSASHIKIHRIPLLFTESLAGRLFCGVYLRYLIWKIKPNVIFSMGNYSVRSKIKQLVLLHWPYLVYPDSIAWKQMSLKDFIKRKIRIYMLRKNLKYANAITVQTQLMKNRLQKVANLTSPIYVVSSTSSFTRSTSPLNVNPMYLKVKDIKNRFPTHIFLLFVTVYYTHKNIEILIPLAKEIKQNNDPFKILISLDINQTRTVKNILNRVHDLGLDDIIINLGHIPRNQLFHIYNHSDAFLMPTLLESFGITYIEAMQTGLPVFTSDLDFAHEICGDAAFYFDPLDHQSIYRTLKYAYRHQDVTKQKVALGYKNIKRFPSWDEINHQYLKILESL